MTWKSERLEATLSDLSQWGPLTSGPKEKKKKGERKIRGTLGPKSNALHSVCRASTGGSTLSHVFSYEKQPEMNVSKGLGHSREGCGWGQKGENSPPKLLVCVEVGI